MLYTIQRRYKTFTMPRRRCGMSPKLTKQELLFCRQHLSSLRRFVLVSFWTKSLHLNPSLMCIDKLTLLFKNNLVVQSDNLTEFFYHGQTHLCI